MQKKCIFGKILLVCLFVCVYAVASLCLFITKEQEILLKRQIYVNNSSCNNNHTNNDHNSIKLCLNIFNKLNLVLIMNTC